ncbi:MAG: hypothetical protein PHT91_02925 [Candidatus Nanoarchaeia archaeon]|nr:hypothetical protein [Candidatus Nanoarchaeia archaeon]MDD5054575.1 hypothetical protein [Candidatus Nanoarchaeia archaeon]MDD5499802.1 hypothetical protein [Candidatus Nanoarchaeia archaeon]
MKKADLELDLSAELILIIIGIIILLILVSAMILNLEKIGDYIVGAVGDVL